MASVYRRINDITMTKLNQRLGLTRYEADEYYKKALDSYSKNKLADAILAMDEAIALLPTSAEYFAARGFFYLEDGQEAKAEVDFAQALKRYPYEMLAHYGRGIIAYRGSQWDAAYTHFTQAYKADPKRAETLYYLALVYHRKGENGMALHFMQQANTAFETAKNKKHTGDATKWIKALERLVALRPPGLPR